MWFFIGIYSLTAGISILSTVVFVMIVVALYQIQKEYPNSDPLNVYNELGFIADNIVVKLIRTCIPPMVVVGTIVVLFHLLIGTFILFSAIAITTVYGIWYAFEGAEE